MSVVRFERLRSSQIREVQELIFTTFQSAAAFSHLLRYCLFANTCAFVALSVDKQVVGFIGGTVSDTVTMIECLCVNRAFRNLGIATSLIDKFMNEAPATSLCELDVRLSNTIARQFYMRRGFKEVCTKAMFYRDEDALTMTRPATNSSTTPATVL